LNKFVVTFHTYESFFQIEHPDDWNLRTSELMTATGWSQLGADRTPSLRIWLEDATLLQAAAQVGPGKQLEILCCRPPTRSATDTLPHRAGYDRI
jgi:hypothetical protein